MREDGPGEKVRVSGCCCSFLVVVAVGGGMVGDVLIFFVFGVVMIFGGGEVWQETVSQTPAKTWWQDVIRGSNGIRVQPCCNLFCTVCGMGTLLY